jgi:hypothetical protein
MRFFNALKLALVSQPPASPEEGWMYFDTVDQKSGVYGVHGWTYLSDEYRIWQASNLIQTQRLILQSRGA